MLSATLLVASNYRFTSEGEAQAASITRPQVTADPLRRREWLSWQADMRSAFQHSITQ
jgi:hypothetical protein